ncbi:MAG: DUF2911 domain-containing protein [Chitinophagaceae bacterium]|nr:DUF2911 domain-containing protein [Chitinophagaceae bacterium]
MRIPGILLFFCFLLFACNNKEENNHTSTIKMVSTDSSAPGRAERPSINPYAGIDVSPMDMSYYPVDYPKLKMAKSVTIPPLARVIYSRPHLQGRHIFHEVLKYDEPWRLGANEATELDLYKDASIQDKKIKAGRYIIYCIPHKDNWTIAINSNIDSWGLEPDAAKDVARFTVPVVKTNNSLEYFTIVFEDNNNTANLLMAWDDAEVRLPFKF